MFSREPKQGGCTVAPQKNRSFHAMSQAQIKGEKVQKRQASSLN